MAHYNDANACTMTPATQATARAKGIAASMGQIAQTSPSHAKTGGELSHDEVFARRLRAAQLPPVEACQSNVFSWLRSIEEETAGSRMPKADSKQRPWLFNLKHRINHMFYSTAVH